MVVPYADPSPVRFWQNYFDCGEYMFARYADSLQLGCDCLGDIHYTDAVIADDFGNPKTIKNAICMHEEDYGVLWKHSDLFTQAREIRRQRRLVISFFTTVGNYDYGFYWYLYLDGTIQLEVKATGILFTSGTPGEYATEVAPGLGAPFHQHLFSARLDMTVDGVRNTVDEVEAERVPMGPRATLRQRLPPQEHAAAHRVGRRSATPTAPSGRIWHIVNPEKTNCLGQPVGYALLPEHKPTLLADEASVISARAAFATKASVGHEVRPRRALSGGRLRQPEPRPASACPSWVAGRTARSTARTSSCGTPSALTHFPRTEDWPIMPVDYAGFTLKPVGFFDRNPALDVPPTRGAHCSGRGEVEGPAKS